MTLSERETFKRLWIAGIKIFGTNTFSERVMIDNIQVGDEKKNLSMPRRTKDRRDFAKWIEFNARERAIYVKFPPDYLKAVG